LFLVFFTDPALTGIFFFYFYAPAVGPATPLDPYICLLNLTPTVVKDSILAIGVTKVYHHGFDN
jgi:hypothetical protein